jgi:hypothetical protein
MVNVRHIPAVHRAVLRNVQRGRYTSPAKAHLQIPDYTGYTVSSILELRHGHYTVMKTFHPPLKGNPQRNTDKTRRSWALALKWGKTEWPRDWLTLLRRSSSVPAQVCWRIRGDQPGGAFFIGEVQPVPNQLCRMCVRNDAPASCLHQVATSCTYCLQ